MILVKLTNYIDRAVIFIIVLAILTGVVVNVIHGQLREECEHLEGVYVSTPQGAVCIKGAKIS